MIHGQGETYRVKTMGQRVTMNGNIFFFQYPKAILKPQVHIWNFGIHATKFIFGLEFDWSGCHIISGLTNRTEPRECLRTSTRGRDMQSTQWGSSCGADALRSCLLSTSSSQIRSEANDWSDLSDIARIFFSFQISFQLLIKTSNHTCMVSSCCVFYPSSQTSNTRMFRIWIPFPSFYFRA